MAKPNPDFRYGRVLGSYVLGRNGKRELRPVLVVSPDHEIIQPSAFDPRHQHDNILAVLGISTQYRNFTDPHVPLPFSSTGNSVTGLTKDSAVILNWYHVISISDDCEFFAGDAPPFLMQQIRSAMRADLTSRMSQNVGTLAQVLAKLHPRR